MQRSTVTKAVEINAKLHILGVMFPINHLHQSTRLTERFSVTMVCYSQCRVVAWAKSPARMPLQLYNTRHTKIQTHDFLQHQMLLHEHFSPVQMPCKNYRYFFYRDDFLQIQMIFNKTLQTHFSQVQQLYYCIIMVSGNFTASYPQVQMFSHLYFYWQLSTSTP